MAFVSDPILWIGSRSVAFVMPSTLTFPSVWRLRYTPEASYVVPFTVSVVDVPSVEIAR